MLRKRPSPLSLRTQKITLRKKKNRIFLLIYIVSWPFVRSQKGHPRLRLGPKIVIRLNSSVGLLRNTRGAMAKAGGPRIWVEKVSANL